MILYNIMLKLKLMIQSNIIIMIKDVRNLKLSFIKYIFNMIIRIKNMIIRQTLNDESVYITVFDSENDLIQTIFQAYASDDVNNYYEYQVIEINTIQSIRKYLNIIHNT